MRDYRTKCWRPMGPTWAALALVLASAAPAAAQGALQDLVGTYPLRYAKSGAMCPVEETGTFRVTSVNTTTISVALNGEPVTAPFKAAERSFHLSFPLPESQGVITLDGSFERRPASVGVVLDMVFPAFMQCKARLTGSKAAPPLAEAPAPTPPSAAPEELDAESAAALNQVAKAQSEEIGQQQKIAELAVREKFSEGKEPLGSWEELLAKGAEAGPLGVLFLVTMLVSLFLGLKQASKPAGGAVGGAGLAGRLMMGGPSLVSGAVGGDRFGGNEGRLSYPEGPDAGAPHNPLAHEALVTAQSPPPQPGPKLSGPSEPSSPEGDTGERERRGNGPNRTGEPDGAAPPETR